MEIEEEHPLVAKAIEIVGTQELLGDAIGVSQNAVHKMLKRQIRVTPLRALLIDKATNSEVAKEQLCPNSPFWDAA